MHEPTDFEKAIAGFRYREKELAPWSPSRKVASQTMGLKFPFIGEAGQKQYESTGTYAGAVQDVCIFLWLSMLPDRPLPDPETKLVPFGQWTPSKALVQPEQALEQAIRWGAENGVLEFSSPFWVEAFHVFCAVLQGMSASEFEVEVEKMRPSGPEESEGSDGPKV